MIRIPTHRTPTHPGEMLLEEFLDHTQYSVETGKIFWRIS
jgi:plasmid maintenance system antidote protein VapI